jgi:hypothetical protein
MDATYGIVVNFGSSSNIVVPEPVHAETTQQLHDVLALVRQRVVSEEDAEVAIATLENMSSAPTNFIGAHLCLAEIYLTGSAPQHGKDPNKALRGMLSFLCKDGECCYVDGRSVLLRAIDDVSKRVTESQLADCAHDITSLANRVPELHSAAIRASLAKLSCIEGCACEAMVQSDATSSRERPLAIFEHIASDNEALRQQILHLESSLRAEQSQRSMLMAALQEERDAKAVLVLRQEAGERQLLERDSLIAELREQLLREKQARQETDAQIRYLQEECHHARPKMDDSPRRREILSDNALLDQLMGYRSDKHHFGGEDGLRSNIRHPSLSKITPPMLGRDEPVMQGDFPPRLRSAGHSVLTPRHRRHTYMN